MNRQSSTSETCHGSDGIGRSGVKDRSRTRKSERKSERKSGRPSLMAALANGRVRTEGYVCAGGEETRREERTVFGE